MEYRDCIVHNIDHIVREQGEEKGLLCRVPENVRENLNPKARNNICFASNSEIRFVMEGDEAVLCLKRMPVREPTRPQGVLEVFQGDYQGSYEISPWPVSVDGTKLVIRRQDWSFIRKMEKTGYTFHPSVTRVLLPYDWGCCLESIEGAMRKPEMWELPGKRLLTYGSSITHGGNASLPSHTYAFLLARRMGLDLINLGCAGSAWMDPAMADYIASRKDWDLGFFELGVNVVELWDGATLYERAWKFLDTILRGRREVPVAVTDMYLNHYDYEKDPRAQEFRDSIRRCAADLSRIYGSRVSYINGKEILGEVRGLSSDGLHPSDEGHETIGRNLAGCLKKIVV